METMVYSLVLKNRHTLIIMWGEEVSPLHVIIHIICSNIHGKVSRVIMTRALEGRLTMVDII